MAKSNIFIVPKEDRDEFNLFVQRANRRIKSNLKYITDNDIKDLRTTRALVSKYGDPINWATRTNPLSRSVKFKSKEDYEDFIEYANKWGEAVDKGQHHRGHPESIKADYKKAIIDALNRTLINKNIPTENGQIPEDILKRIDNMTVEQLANFFGGEADEELENGAFDSDNVREGDPDSFTNYVNSQISWIERVYPNKPEKSKKKKTAQKPKKPKAKKRKTKKRKSTTPKIKKGKKPKEHRRNTKFKEKL